MPSLSMTADVLSIIGFPLALLGFGITIWQARSAKKASEQASKAVAKFRRDLTRLNVVEEFSRTLQTLDNLKRLIRANQLIHLPELFSGVRRSLISIRESTIDLSVGHQQKFQTAIADFKGFEERLEKHLADTSTNVNIPKLLSQISNNADELHTMLVQIRNQIEELPHE